MTFPYGPAIKQVMQARNYPWFDDQNVVSIEKMNVSGVPNQLGPDEWRDIKIVLDGNGNVIGGPWQATTHPGVFWTQNPMPGPSGAFIIALGSQACWGPPGNYHGLTVWRQSENGTILGHRDPNDTYKRQGPPIVHGNIGVHHHGTGADPAHIGRYAAGCQVIEHEADQAEFMHLTMQCPRYVADPEGYRLTATVLEAKDILPMQELPVPPPATHSDDFARCLPLVLVSEGGNDDDARDPGGRTSRGILQREWNTWRQTHPGLPSDVWQAPDDQIAAIYRQEYWDAMQCGELPPGVDYCVFDYGVNSGQSRAIKSLQGALSCTQDGIIGPNTLLAATANAPNASVVVNRICDQRLAFLQGLSTWGTFGHGWSSRVSRVRHDSLAMVGTPTQPNVPTMPDNPPPVTPPVTPPVVLPPALPPAVLPPALQYSLSDEQKAQIAAAIQAAAQDLLKSQNVNNWISVAMTALGHQFPALAVIAYAGITIGQALLNHGATAAAATDAGPTVIGAAGLLALLNKVNAVLKQQKKE